ncbi:hypothetical protein M0R45_014976 [Rubus argutus]|uniref:Uncharacterized protein n=1 Tax=Rubus argutus TaxID=59490 RepID=A0AAW1XPD4_RUBAR
MPMVMERSDGSGSAHGSRRERGVGGALGFVMARRRRGLAWLGRMNVIEAMVTLILELCCWFQYGLRIL